MSATKCLLRVFCIVPPTGKFVREDRCQTPIKKFKTIALRPPIDLLYAAAAFESAGCEVKFCDYPAEEKNWQDFRQDLKLFQPTDLLLNITTLTIEKDVLAAEIAKQSLQSVRTLAIGAHFNTLDIDALSKYSALDVVLRGEYEHSCVELGQGRAVSEISGISWRASGGALTRNAERPFESNLDLFPFPARHLANNSLYFRPDTGLPQTTLVTNRGCPFSCMYCLANQVSGFKNHYRSIESIIQEIKDCIANFGIRNFLFRSELFTQNKHWVSRLCGAILDAGLSIEWACNSRVDTVNLELLQQMKRAGCWIIAYGVESGDQATLDRLGKKARVEDSFSAVQMTRAAGIKSSVYLLIGLPWDTVESVEQQIRFAKLLDPDVLEVFYPYPFPGTPFHALALESGLLVAHQQPKQAYSDPAVPGFHLSIEQLSHLRSRMMRKFYLRPKIIARTLSGARNFGELANYLRVGAAQLGAMLLG